ncbi:MAG TPA: hypothetical protein VF494_12015 [Candidatus Limnocylindrales bacterium]
MHPLDVSVSSERIREFHREAEANRLAGAARPARQARAAWRRHGGAAARWLSAVAADVAIALDPSVCLPSYGRE